MFQDVNSWPDKYKACGAPNQSPVNLSRSFALPCDRLCELQIDKVSVSKATVRDDNGVLKLVFDQGVSPTLKFNGEGYTSRYAIMYHPAQHTIENIQAEAEFVLYFTNPKGFRLALSVPVRSSSGDTPSTSFFNKFVPFVVDNESIPVVLGDSWEIQDIVPENKGFYVYEGTSIDTECAPDTTWIVFSTAVTIDPSDLAKLNSVIPAGNRPLQPVAAREVFYNDGDKIEGPAVKDGKIYMKCRRAPREGEATPESAIKQSGLSRAQDANVSKARSDAVSNVGTAAADQFKQLGGIWGVLSVLVFLGLAYFLFSEKGSVLSRTLFGFFVAIPAFINKFTFGLFFG